MVETTISPRISVPYPIITFYKVSSYPKIFSFSHTFTFGSYNILKFEMFYIMNKMYWAFAGITKLGCYITLLAIYNIKYKLHTRFMLTDMNTIKQNGTIRVNIIEFSACAPIEDIVSNSSCDRACDGTVKLFKV